MNKYVIEKIEEQIYALICSKDGIKAREIAKNLKKERNEINHYLYTSAYMRELCYQDKEYNWHGYIRQHFPHAGLEAFSGYYSYVSEFLNMEEEAWFDSLLDGCKKIGRNLNDTRGLFHSFRDSGEVMRSLFFDLKDKDYRNWEILFELRIKKSKYIRIYADVLVITEHHVFSLEFKMKDKIEQEEVEQAAKYTPYLEVIFGREYDVIPILVLTKTTEFYEYAPLEESTAEIPVCSGDMLCNVLKEYLVTE